MTADNKYTFQILGSDKTKAAFASLHKSIRTTVNAAGAMGAGVAVGLSVMVTQSVRANTEMSRLAQAVGVGSESLSEWSYAAKTVGVEGDKVADIFKDVSDKIGDLATTGGGPGAAVFQRLNLNVRDLISLKPDQQLLAIAGALEQVQSRSEKVFLLESLASDASMLLPLLEDGATGLQALADEAEALGVSITDIDAAKLEAANRSFERVQGVATGLANKVAVEVAPVIEVLAEKFVQTAIEGDRLGKAVTKGFELGTKGAAVLADGIHGVRIVVKGLEVVARGTFAVLTDGFAKVAAFVGEDIRNAIISGFFIPVKSVLGLLAKASGAFAEMLEDVQAVEDRLKESGAAAFEGFASRQADSFKAARDEFAELLAAELPGQVITRTFNEITAEAERRAEIAIGKLAQQVQATPSGGSSETVEDPKDDKEREQAALRLQRLDEQFLTETQKLREKLAEEILIINEAEEQKLIAEEEANARRLRSLEDFTKEKEKLEKKSQKSAGDIMQAGLTLVQAFQTTGNKKLFKAAKALALAKVGAELPASIISSYNAAGGFPLGIPAALAMAAVGAQQIAAIKSSSLGGGASASSAGTAGGAASSAPAPATNLARTSAGIPQATDQDRTPRVVINIAGDVVGDSADLFIEELQDRMNDGDFVLFSPGSRQALDLQTV